MLAIWIARAFFDEVLALAVPSTFEQSVYESRAAWERAVEVSEARVQWDPDYSPRGGKLARRAIQLGLRGDLLRRYAQEAIVQVEDIGALVKTQAKVAGDEDFLLTPAEKVYPVKDAAAAKRLGIQSLG